KPARAHILLVIFYQRTFQTCARHALPARLRGCAALDLAGRSLGLVFPMEHIFGRSVEAHSASKIVEESFDRRPGALLTRSVVRIHPLLFFTHFRFANGVLQ